MKKNVKRMMALLASMTMVMSLAACGGNDTKTTSNTTTEKKQETTADAAATSNETSDGPVEITYATFMVGSNTSASAEADVINAFNEKYEGKIKVVVEELPSDEAFVDKMKVYASSKTLPDVIIGKQGIRELAIENGQAVDLKPYLDEDAEWMKFVGEGAMNYNMTDDGKVYSIANQRQLIGYFYNKDLFAQAGITPAKTWEEFMSNNQKLKDAGITPLALMTGENCWTTNLWIAAMIGTDGAEGNAFMNSTYPDSYNTPSMVKALTMMQTCLKDYTTSDAVGAIYANAANNFLQGNAAMIANGPWMCPDFTDATKALEGFGDKVGVAMYPGEGLIAQYEVGYIMCTANKSPEVQAAALEFLKFKTGEYAQSVFLEQGGVLPLTDNVPLSDAYKAANPLLAEMVEMKPKYTFENIDNTAYSSVVEQCAASYPELVYDEITPEQMAQKLTDAIALNK